MARYLNVVAVLLLSMGGFVSGQKELEIDKDDNIEPFALLCRIYNVAKNSPINYVDLQEADKIVQEIDALNASFAEEKLANETEKVENSTKTQLTPTIMREAALAQISLNQITQRAHKILEEIRKINVTGNIEKAKDQFSQVIFGEGNNESQFFNGVLNGVGGRAEACGNTVLSSKGTSAGKNLVVDFFCLCVQRTDEEGVNQVCGFYVGVKNSKIGWNEIGPLGSSTMWASIKGGCGKHMQQHPKSTAEARHILEQFLKHLKTGGVYRWGSGNKVEGSNRHVGMLGTAVGTKEGDSGKDILCDGKKGRTPPGGFCVYYGRENWETNILWLKPLKTALTSVDAVNNQTATIQRAIEKLQMLLQRAEEIYETAKVILEVQKPVSLPAAFQNASGNLTSFNVTRTRSYSHSSHACFIPALVLFL